MLARESSIMGREICVSVDMNLAPFVTATSSMRIMERHEA